MTKYEKALPGEISEELSLESDDQSEDESGEETLLESEPKSSLIDSAMGAWEKDRLRIKDLPEEQREILIELGRGRIPHSGSKNDGVLLIHLQQLEAELHREQHRMELVRDLENAMERGAPDPRIYYFHSGLLMKADRARSLRSYRRGVDLESTTVAMRIVDSDRFLNQTYPSVMATHGALRSTLLDKEYKGGSRSDEDPFPSSIVSESANRSSEIISAQEHLVSESLRLINNATTGNDGLNFMQKQLSAWRKPDKNLLKPDLAEEIITTHTAVESALRTVLLLPYEERLSNIETIKIRDAKTLSADRELLATQLSWLMRLALVSRDVTGEKIPLELTRFKDKTSGTLVDNPKIKALKQATD